MEEELKKDAKPEKVAKKARDISHALEIIVIIMLGITAIFTAWASWIGSLHGGNQATSYTTSNNIASEGNSEYNAAVQAMMQDMLLWNEVSDLQLDVLFAQDNENNDELTKASYKLYCKLNDNLSETMAAAIGWDFSAEGEPTDIVAAWLEKDEALGSPFTNQEFVDSYFATANELLAKSQAEFESGKESNANGDAYGLVTVVYSVVLFLLGIAGSFKSQTNRIIVIVISVIAFILITLYMCTIPLPNGFSLASFSPTNIVS